MGVVVTGPLVVVMFPRMVVEATGPEKVTSAPTGAAVIGPPVAMSARTAAVATGVLATKRGVAAVYPSSENKMKTKLIPLSAICLSATLQLSAQVVGLPVNPSQIQSGTVNNGVYDITLKDGTRQTGNIYSRVDSKGNGSIVSWPDRGSVTVTRVHNGNAVIIGPSN